MEREDDKDAKWGCFAKQDSLRMETDDAMMSKSLMSKPHLMTGDSAQKKTRPKEGSKSQHNS